MNHTPHMQPTYMESHRDYIYFAGEHIKRCLGSMTRPAMRLIHGVTVGLDACCASNETPAATAAVAVAREARFGDAMHDVEGVAGDRGVAENGGGSIEPVSTLNFPRLRFLTSSKISGDNFPNNLHTAMNSCVACLFLLAVNFLFYSRTRCSAAVVSYIWNASGPSRPSLFHSS